MALTCLAPAVGARKSYDRGIKTTVFVPKKTMTGGVSLSYINADADDFDFLFIDGIDVKAYTFSVSPHFAYSFKDDMAIGIRGTFRRTFGNINAMNIQLSEDMEFPIDHWRTMQNSFKAGVFWRTYMSLFGSKIVGFYNDLQLSYSYGRAKTLSHTGDDLNGIYQVNQSLRLGARPGLAVFVMNNVAVDVSLDVAGFNVSWKDQTRNQVEKGHFKSSSANFSLNLLSVGIGVTTYF